MSKKNFWVICVASCLGLMSLSISLYLYFKPSFEDYQSVDQVSQVASLDVQETKRIEINVPSRKLYLIQGNLILKEYPVAVGKSKAFMTPVGDFKVQVKDNKPGWTNPYTLKKIPPGPNNPLGTRWIGFLTKAGDIVYGIHGTNQPESIGKFISHGCVRMKITDAEELFDLVDLGSPVKVKYERVEIQEHNNRLKLTLHPDPYGLQVLTTEKVVAILKRRYPEVLINKVEVSRLLSTGSGSSIVASLHTVS